MTTVSPHAYSREIQTPEFGCGLEGVVQTRSEDIVGLLNGVDSAIWNPALDASIPARYSDRQPLGKVPCAERNCLIGRASRLASPSAFTGSSAG